MPRLERYPRIGDRKKFDANVDKIFPTQRKKLAKARRDAKKCTSPANLLTAMLPGSILRKS
jgi:hypothetical protein